MSPIFFEIGKKMKYLYLIFVLLMGCANEYHTFSYTNIVVPSHAPIKTIPVYIDKSFGTEDQISIFDAIDSWNYALNGYIIFKIEKINFDMGLEDMRYGYDHGGLFILKVLHSCEFIPKEEDPRLTTIAWTVKSKHEIYMVRDYIQTEDMASVLRHELGHVLRIEHVNSQTLMNPIFSKEKYRCIDETTIAAIAKQYNLNINNLNYCIDN